MLCYFGAVAGQLEVENGLDNRSSNKRVCRLPAVPKPGNKHKGELVPEVAGTRNECRDITNIRSSATGRHTPENNHNVRLYHGHIRVVVMPQATANIQLCLSNSKYDKTIHDALLSATGDLLGVESFDALRDHLANSGFTLIPRTVEKRKLSGFPVKPFLIAGTPSLSKVKRVEEDVLEFVKDEDVQRYTRIGSFDEMDGEGRCRDSIIEVPTYQGATITSAATLLAKGETHDKREEEIGILLNPRRMRSFM
ncbi:hypothetical protein FQN51_004516 [Onygenales sp. PD_10]|nr:hypothetical protein FQN51_004516 [Onygenales sp. PD_10]